jgi:hypothetical protein
MFNGLLNALFNSSVYDGSGLNDEKVAFYKPLPENPRKSEAEQTWSGRKFIMRTSSSFGFICR